MPSSSEPSINTPLSSPSSPSEAAPLLKVVNFVDVPRGGWSYLVPETGIQVRASSARTLKAAVRNHLAANHKAIGAGLDEIIEDVACRNLDKWSHWCSDAKELAPVDRQQSRWSSSEVLRFLKTVVEWGLKTRFSFVEAAEAERRAAICASCPLNVTVKGCLGCSGVSALVRSIRGKRATTFDSQLNVCNACGCELKVKTLLPLDVIDNTGVEYPDHCWQRTDSVKSSPPPATPSDSKTE